MGVKVRTVSGARRMGQATTSQYVQTAGADLMKLAPATGPAAPFVAVAGAIVDLVGSLFGFGYNPEKLNDTAVTEGAQLAYNSYWYALTGEDLGGVSGANGCTCTPGQCGAQNCAIFDPQGTQYPNVPSGPLGFVDANQIIAQATQIYQNGRAKLQRSASYADYDANWQGALAKFQQVAQAQAAAPSTGSGASATGGLSDAAASIASLAPSLPGWWPYAAAGLLAYAIL